VPFGFKADAERRQALPQERDQIGKSLGKTWMRERRMNSSVASVITL
jgi:hypothetical protein